MDIGAKTSFIPKDAAVPVARRPQSHTTFSDLLILISVVLLIASVALAAGVFLYLQFLQSASASKLEQLRRAKEAFDPALIQDMTRLDDRLNAADTILSQHLAPSTVFRLLEQLTLQTVSFRKFKLEAVDAQSVRVEMDGVARSVNSIALQADNFGRSGVLVSPIFSNIDRKADGVHFNLSATVNPQPLKYAERMQASLPPTQTPLTLPESGEQVSRDGFGTPDDSVREQQLAP